MWLLIVIVAVVLACGGYLLWQYRGATPPATGAIPIYSRAAEVPISEIPPSARTGAEQQLRAAATVAAEGRRITDETIMATDGPLTWDALRHNTGSFLAGHGYTLAADRRTPDNAVQYLRYRHANPVRRWFNDDDIVVAAVDAPVARAASGRDLRVYGYFTLSHEGR